MAHDIELVDREFGHVRVPISRKIKFKGISFTNISKRWNNFRLNRLKSKYKWVTWTPVSALLSPSSYRP